MDSSPGLSQQSQNKIYKDFQRMKNEQNKKPVDLKSSKLLSSSKTSNQDIENKDPERSGISRKALGRPGGSKLPVLAKSLHLQPSTSFSHSNCRWEEKPLAGKAKKKKPCTRPVPFNFSQPRSSRVVTERQQPPTNMKSNTGTRAMKPENTIATAKPTKHSALSTSSGNSTKGVGKSNLRTTNASSHQSAQTGPSSTLKTSSIPENVLNHNRATASVQPALSAEACLNDMNRLSLKDPSQPSDSQTAQTHPAQGPSEKGSNFQLDHAALLSILRNEGVSVSGPTSMTPQSKAYNYVPERVSIMKSRQKASLTTGPGKLVQFSPDPAALQSILLNEGVKAGRPVGTTPRNSVSPSGRGTSIYTAQRVPVRRAACAEVTEGASVVGTPLNKWTPQRVTRHRPMSAMKWHLSTQPSPYITPGVRSFKSHQQPQQEEKVVQRLFDDQEEKPTDIDPDAQAEQLTIRASEAKSHCEVEGETSRAASDEQQRFKGGQIFLQVPQRESVIFFSTGKKLTRAPRIEEEKSSLAQQDQPGPGLFNQRKLLQTHEVSVESEPKRQINPSEHHQKVQKSSSLSPAVAMLRKRLPPLEELRMDEEVATYTSMSVLNPPGFLPPRPRFGNPVASILHFEESTRFVPIGLAGFSSPPHD